MNAIFLLMAWLLLGAAALPGRSTAAQVDPHAAAAPDPRWLPWLGCWEPVGEPWDDDIPPARGAYLVCVVRPAAGSGVDIHTRVDGSTAMSRTLLADGARHDVDDSGCRGFESATWSGDGRRVYLRSELECEGGVRRMSSGVLMMLPHDVWLDAQLVAAGEDRAMRVRRYRLAVAAGPLAEVGPPANRALAAATARAAAAGRLSVDDVVEAAHQLAPEVVQTMLVERGAGFDLDRATLLALSEAGVATDLIDLMVALSYPQYFAIDRVALTADYRPRDAADERRRRDWPRRHAGYDPFGYGGYGDLYYWRFLRGPYFYSPFGYGDPYWWWLGRSGPVIVLQDGGRRGDRGEAGGRVVKGRGYTRGGRRQGEGEDQARPATGLSGSGSGSVDRASGSSGSPGGSSGGSSGGSVTTGGHRNTTGSSEGTAKRRGGGE